MFYNECEPFDWVSRNDMQNSNYGYITLEQFKNAPKKWLASLPMWEYAHVLMVITSLRWGGDPTKYLEDLYKARMTPVLHEYYNKLAEYRFHRALYYRKDDGLKKIITGLSISDEMNKMKCITMGTRQKLREICKEYEEYLKTSVDLS